MDIADPDVQDELEAMSNSSKASFFGPNRVSTTQNKPNEMRLSKPTRLTFPADNVNAIDAGPITGSTQQPNRPISPPHPLSIVDKATKQELEAIMKKPAHTSEEKFLVLDARDKLVRLMTRKTIDIKRAESTKGVCPDMCPEKERLSREAKHRVASFESIDGSKTAMNHSIGVKEYSRSSADQEVPLPHELRPEPVLKLTMTYLLQNIMDLCDDSETNISDWFHFLWDRTRGLRKDITQQELCSPGAVLLVEQCARFHIHCAARLVAEEPQVFDQKINTENLTKCLQTLKYMYHDLDLKMIRCPNEAEFRCYVVLLNLHDSNFLWEVKQLHDDILRSPEIQFAIKVYLAIESNNYVKFFSLVRSTTYMNACILLRYFTQVRVKALQVMFKAYVPRYPVYMSISNLAYLLAFEDYEQCAQFLEYYGLTCERDEDRVIFDRGTFYYPDMPFILDRAINIVEHKRHSTVGEAIHGCTLDTKSVLEKYQPHDSFDENGILLPKAWMAEDQDFYRPEARTEARLNKSQAIPVKEDDTIFKMPTAPKKASPKQRLSPKTVTSTENNTSSSAGSLFSTSKFTSNSAASSNSTNIFKTNAKSSTSTAETNIFGSSANNPSQTNIFVENASKNIFSASQRQPTDSIDSGIFKASTEQSTNSSSIFSGFSQKSETTTNLFTQSTNDSKNIFKQSGSTNATPIFGGFSVNNAPRSANNSLFGAQNTENTSNIFGQSKPNYKQMPGIEPLSKQSPGIMQRSDGDATQIEKQRKQREMEEQELERRKQIEAEAKEKERQRLLEQERKEMERKRLEQKTLQIEKAANQLTDVILNEFIEKSINSLVTAEVERHRFIIETVQNIYADLANDVIHAELERIALDVKMAWDKNILGKYFASWRKTVRKRIEQRQKIENTPQWMPIKPMNEIIPELHHPRQAQTLSLMKRYRSGLPSKLVIPPIRDDSIDLWSIIVPELIKLNDGSTKMLNLYWKCVISLPDVEEDSSYKSINEWLNNVFVRQLSKHPRRKDIFFLEQNNTNGQRVNICMRTFIGAKMLNESQRTHEAKDIEGTNAILFFMTAKNLNVTRARLKAILKAIQLNDAAGIIIYSLGTHNPNDIKRALRLHEMIDSEKIDECVFTNRGANALCHSTKHCLKYAAANSFYDDQLEMQKTVTFLSKCLTDELWQRIYLSMSRNPTLLEASTQIKFLIDYHNQAIEHLISMCSPSCTESPTIFSHELRTFVPQHQLDIPLSLEYFPDGWHELAEKHQNQLSTFLKSLIVRPTIDLDNVKDVPSLQMVVLRFVESHISSKSHAERTAYKIIQHLLAFMKPVPSDTQAFKNKLSTYSWLDSFPIFTVDLLSFQYNRFSSENRLPDYVIYDKEEYRDYTRNAWWLELNEELLKNLTANVIQKLDVTVNEFEQSRKRQRLDESRIANAEKMDLEETLAKGYASLASADKTLAKMNENQSMCKGASKDFGYRLYEQERVLREAKDLLKNLKHNK